MQLVRDGSVSKIDDSEGHARQQQLYYDISSPVRQIMGFISAVIAFRARFTGDKSAGYRSRSSFEKIPIAVGTGTREQCTRHTATLVHLRRRTPAESIVAWRRVITGNHDTVSRGGRRVAIRRYVPP